MNLEDKSKEVIVISGINLRSGGPLTIIKDCLGYLSASSISKQYRIVALVHDKKLMEFENIEYIEFPDSFKSWFRRLYYEYIYFNKLSKQLQPFLWMSLHDVTPNVHAKYKAVYMHNPSIVNKIKLTDWKFDKKYILFSLFYKFVYKFNINKNKFCIVQQNWFKKTCADILKIPESKFIVARPKQTIQNYSWSAFKGEVKTFFFPSFPRPFKNFEVVGEASRLLLERGYKDIQVVLTIDDKFGKYGSWIYKKFSDCNIIKFVGIIESSKMFDYYDKADCLIFPSRLETWGLPISEFLPSNRPMILADEPYAHETADGAKCAAFFKTNDSVALADLMEALINKNYSSFKTVSFEGSSENSVDSYEELFGLMLNKIRNDNK